VGQEWQEEGGVWLCLSICKFIFPSSRSVDKTGRCKEKTGILGNVESLVL